LAPQTGTLLGLAKKAPFTLGVELNRDLAADPPPHYFEALRSSFNLGIIDDGLYWRSMEPIRGFLNYSGIDQQINLFQGKGFKNFRTLRGHPIYYPSTNPDWLFESDLTAQQLVGFLQRRVKELVERYRGIIHEWVVVNQPYFPGQPQRKIRDVLYKRIGPEYIEIAFEVARKTDPSAVLIFNGFDNHLPGAAGTEATLKTVSKLKAKGLVDGVGLQMHLNASQPPEAKQLIQAMKEYPVPVYVTELDVDLSGLNPQREDRLQRQATVYRDVLEACLESGVCSSVSVWGIGDQYSWLVRSLKRPNSDGTLFGDDFEPKPAYRAWYDVLQKWVGSS
jgi:endo-1,4-beta-xylanase